MLQTRVIPSLLLKSEALVKTKRFRRPDYVGDPVNTVRIFNQMEVDELVFLDITATREKKRPAMHLIRDIAGECFMPFGYGGGIRTLRDIKEIFTIGVEKVIINTMAVEDPSFVKQAADQYGSQSIVVSLDVKRSLFGSYQVFTHSGRKHTGRDPVSLAQEMESSGAGEILLYSMDRDGTWEGYDLELLRTVTSAVTIPVIACGGPGRLEDFSDGVRKGGAAAVSAGSMFVYQKKGMGVLVNYPTRDELKKYLD
jgi:cyclase